MRYLKNSILFIIITLMLIIFTSCNNENIKTWYRINMGAGQMNVITISEKTSEGFSLKASCSNGANLGEFEGYFIYESKNKAVFSGKSFDGIEYKVIAELKNEIMNISVSSDRLSPEHSLLDLGYAVTLSGEYSTEKPTFDYSERVLEEVFLSDENIAKSVKEYLGEEEYESLIHNFGISTIFETEEDGHVIIRGNLRGIGNWCTFCADANGYFYIINDYEYFSNDPIYKYNAPDFIK
ncbi:MAG: hypothetical protein E7398_02425 [Ruminococcaceae bacterium]|nr:hypothetical protein [Oscillospiraceae bacterium]